MYLTTTGHVNYGPPGLNKKVDEWHFDSVAFVAVIILRFELSDRAVPGSIPPLQNIFLVMLRECRAESFNLSLNENLSPRNFSKIQKSHQKT